MLRHFSSSHRLRSRARFTALFFLFALTGVCHAAPPVWLRLKCADFSIYTDATRRDLENFALTYAAFRQISREVLLPPDAAVPPSTILLFRRHDALKKHTAPLKDRDMKIGAFSLVVDDHILTALSVDGDREDAQETLFEFETIWTLGRLGYSLPTWIAQGAGEVFSSLKVEKTHAVLGKNPGRFDHELSIPWKRFFRINEASPEYKGDKDAGAFHAQAWAVMHWVLLHENGRERFQRVASEHSLLHADKEIVSVLDCPVSDLTRELYRSSVGRLQTRKFPFDENALRATWTVEPAPPFEVVAYRADLLAAARKTEEARAELTRAAALAPDEPPVLEALARFALREGDAETAISHYRRAMEFGSKNSIPLLRSASAWLDESQLGGGDVAGNAGSNAAKAIGEIREVLSREPRNLDAYALLGRALFVSNKLNAKDLDELSPGIVPGDDGARVRFYRALLFLRLNQINRAAEDLRAIIADPSVSSLQRNRAESVLTRELKLPKTKRSTTASPAGGDGTARP